jgi:hypothetical protein
MNRRGTPENLIPSHPGNTNAVKSGAYSERLINARAEEILVDLLVPELDAAGRMIARECARLEARIEAIECELDRGGLVNKKGEERTLLPRRETLGKRLLEANDRYTEALERGRRHAALTDVADVEADTPSYIRSLAAIGADLTVRPADRISALRTLIDLGAKGTLQYYEPRALPYEGDQEVEAARAELAEADRQGHLDSLRDEAARRRLGN